MNTFTQATAQAATSTATDARAAERGAAGAAGPDPAGVGPDGSVQTPGGVISGTTVRQVLDAYAKDKRIIVLDASVSGSDQLAAGVQGLLEGAQSGDASRVADDLSLVLRGTFEIHGIGKVGPAPNKVPGLEGLPKAGHSAVAVLDAHPSESFNARAQVNRDELDQNSTALGVQQEVQDVLQRAADRVKKSAGPLAVSVATGAQVVYTVIQPALPNNDDLARDAAALTGYFDDPVAKAQQTKKVVGKAKAEATQKTTQAIQDQANVDARAQVRSDINAKLNGILDQSGATTTTTK